MSTEPEAAPEPDTTPEPDATPDTKPEPQSVAAPDISAEPDATGEPQPSASADTTPEPEPIAEPDTAAEPEAAPEPGAAAEPQPTPEPDAAAEPPSETAPEPGRKAAVPRPAALMASRVHAVATTPPAVLTPPLAIGAAAFGRVDDSGTVYVQDGDIEREVGQYPDVPGADALAFYVRKFEDLAAQVHLLGQRLGNGTVPAKEARSSLAALRAAAVDVKAVGDLPALRAELDRVDGLVAERSAADEAQRAAAKAVALAEREAIVAEAEQIAATPPASMHFKHAGERIQALLDAWKSAQRSGSRLDKRTEDPLWKRLSAARATVDRLRRAHFAQVGEQRSSARAAKEELIARAEELQSSTDWRAGSEEYRSLMDRWKAAGRLSRKDDDALWARFRGAQEAFFAARTAANSAQDEEYRGNLAVKEGLLAEAEALLPVTDSGRAKKVLAGIQDRWDEAGRVPRDDLDRVENRLRAVIDKVREHDGGSWTRSAPDVVARGSGLVEQLRQQVADLATSVREAEARGDSRAASRAAKEKATKQAWLDQAEASLSDLSR